MIRSRHHGWARISSTQACEVFQSSCTSWSSKIIVLPDRREQPPDRGRAPRLPVQARVLLEVEHLLVRWAADVAAPADEFTGLGCVCPRPRTPGRRCTSAGASSALQAADDQVMEVDGWIVLAGSSQGSARAHGDVPTPELASAGATPRSGSDAAPRSAMDRRSPSESRRGWTRLPASPTTCMASTTDEGCSSGSAAHDPPPYWTCAGWPTTPSTWRTPCASRHHRQRRFGAKPCGPTSRTWGAGSAHDDLPALVDDLFDRPRFVWVRRRRHRPPGRLAMARHADPVVACRVRGRDPPAAVLVRRPASPRRAALGARPRLGPIPRRRPGPHADVRGGRLRPRRSGATHARPHRRRGRGAGRRADDASPGRRALGRMGRGYAREAPALVR